MKNDSLSLENQLCFPLYACAREVVKKYKPFLDEIGLTYTQYIVMMVMWKKKNINLKSLGEELYLDSGTLTPLLKKMEQEGLVSRKRSSDDERNLIVSITQSGEDLRKKALSVPKKMQECIRINREDAIELHRILHELLINM